MRATITIHRTLDGYWRVDERRCARASILLHCRIIVVATHISILYSSWPGRYKLTNYLSLIIYTATPRHATHTQLKYETGQTEGVLCSQNGKFISNKTMQQRWWWNSQGMGTGRTDGTGGFGRKTSLHRYIVVYSCKIHTINGLRIVLCSCFLCMLVWWMWMVFICFAAKINTQLKYQHCILSRQSLYNLHMYTVCIRTFVRFGLMAQHNIIQIVMCCRMVCLEGVFDFFLATIVWWPWHSNLIYKMKIIFFN